MTYLDVIRENIEKGHLQEAVKDMMVLMRSGNRGVINLVYYNFNNGKTLKTIIGERKIKIAETSNIRNVNKLRLDLYYYWNSNGDNITIDYLNKYKVQEIFNKICRAL
ncbi:hypothetical protein NNC19_05005 [Clostridium sp. SHJSY1]|uniref:hypothetical protein n=1 Tax=Clostridium sp. SHJSY1 TaxID=2942483 RepID=UPI002874F8B0|nr:hypothetical protein [Clostridium sp. SHJSY1]MDS0525031.1 hypothetical protein [Clostridium sp. SHJSY1]